MVIVVQFLAANQDAERNNVGCRIRAIVVAVAPIVADTVDDAGRRHRYPHHLHGPHGDADGAEQDHVQDQQSDHALPAVFGVQIAFDPVRWRAVAVLFHRFHVLGFSAIQLGALPEHFLDAAGDRAMWIFLGVAFGVVLAMDRRPFLGDLAGGQPQPETEEMTGDGMQFQRAVRLVTVQIDGDAGDGDVGDRQGVEKYLPAERPVTPLARNSNTALKLKFITAPKWKSHMVAPRAKVRYFPDFERDCTLNRPRLEEGFPTVTDYFSVAGAVSIVGRAPRMRISRCGNGTEILCSCKARQIARLTSEVTPPRPFSGSPIQKPTCKSRPSAPKVSNWADGGFSLDTRSTVAAACSSSDSARSTSVS